MSLQMPSDWRETRDAIEAAYSAMGETSPDNIPDRDWQLAGLVIAANHEALKRTCAECGKKIDHLYPIVCLDCKCALHEECAPKHFWPNGRPPRDLAHRAHSYADDLDAHLDEGGKYGVNNVLDLIHFIRELAPPPHKPKTIENAAGRG